MCGIPAGEEKEDDMAKILWVWKYDFYGEWYDVVYDSGRIISHTDRTMPKTVKRFLSSAKEQEVTIKKGRLGGYIETKKTLYFTEISDDMPLWLQRKVQEGRG